MHALEKLKMVKILTFINILNFKTFDKNQVKKM